MKEQIVKVIEEEKIIAIVRGVEREKLLPLAGALRKGGIRLLEVAYPAGDDASDDWTAQAIRSLVQEFGDELFVGAGTVLKARQAERTAAAGGRFIISPDVNEPVIRTTHRLGLLSIPGALTPTEIAAAASAGADFVKLFPAAALGPEYIRAVKAPLSGIRFLAVGGIHDKNMAEFYKAGVRGFGIGSNITDKRMIDGCDWAGVQALASRYVAAAKSLG